MRRLAALLLILVLVISSATVVYAKNYHNPNVWPETGGGDETQAESQTESQPQTQAPTQAQTKAYKPTTQAATEGIAEDAQGSDSGSDSGYDDTTVIIQTDVQRLVPFTTEGYEVDLRDYSNQEVRYDVDESIFINRPASASASSGAVILDENGEVVSDGTSGIVKGIWSWHTYENMWSYEVGDIFYEDEWAACYNPYTDKYSWFYFDENRCALESWQWIKGNDGTFKLYYLNSITDDLDKCAMAHSGSIDGKTLNSQGVWVTGMDVQVRYYPYYPHNYIQPEAAQDRENLR